MRGVAQRFFRLTFARLVAVTSALVTVVGCSSSSSVSTGPSPVKCEVTLSTANVSAGGGTGTITVTTGQECAWSASTQVGWIAGLSPTSGQGNGQVAFSIGPNPSQTERQGEVTVNDSRVQIRQEGATCQFTISSSNQEFESPGGAGTVTIAGIQGCPWTARSNESWITVTPSSGAGSGVVEFRVAFNPQGGRTGTLSIAGRDLTVTQLGQAPSPPPTSPAPPNPPTDPTPPPPPPPPPPPTDPPPPPPPPPPSPPTCNYTVDSTAQAFPHGGGTGVPVAVTSPSGCNWTAQSNASWISITSGASGSGNGSVAFNVAANTGLARTGSLTVVSTTVTVTQVRDPATCRYTLDPGGASMGYAGGNVSMSVSTDGDCSWTAQSSAAWITITSGAGGTGNGSLAFSVAANNGLARTGTVTVGSATATITQLRDPATCRYTLNPGSSSVSYMGGNVSMGVSTDSDCSWTAQSNTPWITITSGASGNGNGNVTYTVAANSGLSRTGGLTVGFSTATVAQARNPATCRFSIDPSGASVGSAGGNGSINVSTESDCSWVPTVTSPWIVITSGGNGATGSSTISWSVGSNTGPAKTAEILVMGNVFTITQAGS